MKKVLIVDDSPTVRKQVGEVLSAAGFEVLEASDGVDGIACIETESDLGIVLLDVNMPRMGGLDMLEQVKRNGRHADLPIVMLTSEGHKSMIARAKHAGAKGWVVKPFKSDLLVGAVRKLIAA